MMIRHGFTRKKGRSSGSSDPVLAEIVALRMLLLMCHRGIDLPSLQHAILGCNLIFSSALLGYVYILCLL